MDLSEEKLLFSIGTSLLMFGSWILTSKITSLSSSLSTLIGGLTATLAIFCGAKVTNQWLQGKNGDTQLASQDIDMTEDDQAIADKADMA